MSDLVGVANLHCMKFHKTEFPMHLELVVLKEHSCTNSQKLMQGIFSWAQKAKHKVSKTIGRV